MATKQSNLAKTAGGEVSRAGDVELSSDLPVFTPATDIYDDKEAIVVLADMPGVDQQDLEITLEDDVLTITGRQRSEGFEGHQLVHRGYETGIFRRSFNILASVDHGKIAATINNGILRVTIPKAEEAKPRKITVTAE